MREAKKIWEFVDDTFCKYCHSQDNKEQQQLYSRHKKLHDNNYQAIITSDELVSSLVDLFMRSTADWTMWQWSDCEEAIQQIMQNHDLLWIYDDEVYQVSYDVTVSWENSHDQQWLSTEKKSWNQALFLVHIAVKQVFKCTQVLWTYTIFNKSVEADWQSVSAHFIIIILLINYYTCLHQNSNAES